MPKGWWSVDRVVYSELCRSHKDAAIHRDRLLSRIDALDASGRPEPH